MTGPVQGGGIVRAGCSVVAVPGGHDVPSVRITLGLSIARIMAAGLKLANASKQTQKKIAAERTDLFMIPPGCSRLKNVACILFISDRVTENDEKSFKYY